MIPDANITLGGSGASRTIDILPDANQFGGPATITMTVSDGVASIQISFDITVTTDNDAPTISTIGNQSTLEDTATGTINFTIGDVETAADSLMVTAMSDDQALVPDANITLGGSGASRTISILPGLNQEGGPATISVTVSDGAASTQTTFTLTVSADNDTPTISTIGNQQTGEDIATGAIVFTIGDVETAAGSLILTATSDDQTLVPNANITLGGMGENRTISILPGLNESGGPATITVTVSDGVASTQTAFMMTVSNDNDAPTISAIANQTTLEDTAMGVIAFTVDDVETAADLLTITATSDDQTLVPNANITLGGTGATRTIDILPDANQFGGPVTITVTVSDGVASTPTTFDLTVTTDNDLPTISAIGNQMTEEDTATGAIPFTIDDVETALDSLTVSATSDDQTLVPNANITFGGSAANRTIDVLPGTNQFGGPATITVSVGDGITTISTTFTMTVSSVNDIPVARAGVNQRVNEADMVNLDGTDSFDPDSDGSIASYSWTQTDSTGFDVLLTGADTANPSFIAPEITRSIDPTVLIFSLIVTDNVGNTSEADAANVSVNNINAPPIADAGNNRFVDESEMAILDGRDSVDEDIDGSVASYLWTQTSGVEVLLKDDTSVIASFDPPYVNSNEVLEFALTVTDNEGGESIADMVTITVTNVAVDAGVDQQVTEGDTVRLNGINSQAINGDISRYRWTQLEGPDVVLDDGDNPVPSFVAPQVDAAGTSTLLVFELEVVDVRGARDYDTVFINVRDELLTRTAASLDVQLVNKSVASGDLYQFTLSNDPFGLNAVDWYQVSGPEVVLIGADTFMPSFIGPTEPTAPPVRPYSSAVFEVRSTDLDGLVARATVNVNILESISANAVPVANAGVDQEVAESDTVFLDAVSATTDPDGGIVGYYWHQTSGPMVALSSIIDSRPTFVAPAIGLVDDGAMLTFEVLVIDNAGFVDRDSVTVTVRDNEIIGFADEVTTMLSTTGDSISVETGSASNLIGLVAVDPTTIVDSVNRPVFLAYGLVAFGLRVVPGDTAQISFTLPAPAPADFTWWKYSTTGGWMDYGASFNATRDVVTVTITDNVIGDDDPAPGIIRDPGGLGPAPVMKDTSAAKIDSGSSGGGGSAGPWLMLFLLFSALIAISRSNRSPRQSRH